MRQAIYDQDAEAVKAALKAGAQTEDADYTGFTMLHLAAVRKNTDVVDVLIAKGADITARTNQGMTAVHLAARSGRPGVLKALARHGADLQPLDNNQATPLCVAMQYCQAEAAVTLLHLGVRPDMDKINRVAPVESEGEKAWQQTRHALHNTLGLMRANRLKHIRLQMNRRPGHPAAQSMAP